MNDLNTFQLGLNDLVTFEISLKLLKFKTESTCGQPTKPELSSNSKETKTDEY